MHFDCKPSKSTDGFTSARTLTHYFDYYRSSDERASGVRIWRCVGCDAAAYAVHRTAHGGTADGTRIGHNSDHYFVYNMAQRTRPKRMAAGNFRNMRRSNRHLFFAGILRAPNDGYSGLRHIAICRV